LLLARAVNPEQASRIWKPDRRPRLPIPAHRPPREESYGTVAVFEDLYGNKWDLLQLKADS